MASRAEIYNHIAHAFDDVFHAYIDRKWGDNAFLPPPETFEMWEDEREYRIGTRFSFSSGDRIDLSFTATDFFARDFSFMDAQAALDLWANAYAERVDQDFRESLHEIRHCVDRAHNPYTAPLLDITAPTATAAVLAYPFSTGHPARLSEAGKAYHRERKQAHSWAWRPALDVFTRVCPTPKTLMLALLQHERRSNPCLHMACDTAKRAIDLAHITPLTASWGGTVRAMLAQVFPTPDLEQEVAMEIAMADPYFCDSGGAPVRQHDARQVFRAQYEQRWDMAALHQRLDPVAEQQNLMRNIGRDLDAQMQLQTAAVLMGRQTPLAPWDVQGGLSDAHLRAMEDAATYGMGIVNNGPECTGYIAREQLWRDTPRMFPPFYGAARVRETAAEARAEKLLRENLSDSQLSQLDASGCFDVVGGSSGKTYRITRGRQMNVYQLDKNGRRVRGLCFVPEGNLVPGDVMLIQKLSLELNESKAVATANVF
jgi:hypothetical protein